MRRDRRSVQSKSTSTAAAHPLKRHPPFCPCVRLPMAKLGTLILKRNGTGLFMPFAGFGKGVKRMLTIHKTIDGKITPLETMEDGCWVNLTYPSEKELKTVSTALGVEPTFLRAALDEEETSRIESEDGQTLIIVDIPAVEKDEAGVVYSTLPMGIVVTALFVIVVSLVKDFAITSTFTFAVVNSPRLKFTSISPFSFTLTSVLFVPSEYIVSTLLSCTSSGSLSVNITSSIGISERFDIVNVYVYFSAAEIVVFAGILHVCTMLTPILLIVSVNVGIVSAFFPSASIVPVIETSFL